MDKEQRIEQLEYLRGFGILAVVLIHASGNFTYINKPNGLQLVLLFINLLSQFAVPLFLFISGFVLCSKYFKEFSMTSFYKKRFFSIIPQYLIFTCAYMLWNNRTNLAAGINLESLIENIIFAKASWHLWFFAIIIQFYILYPFILKLYKTLKEKQRQAVFLLIIAALQILWNLSKNSLFIPSIDIPLFFSHIIYFGAGIFVKDNYEKIKSTLKKLKTINLIFILLIINCISVAEAALALFSGYSYYEIPYYFYILDIFITPVMYLMQIVLLYRLSDYLYKKKSSIATITYSLGKHSFGIYLIHVIFLNVSGKLIKVLMHIDHNYFMFYVLLFIGTLILSYGTIYILSFMPYSELIVGIYKNYGNK